MDTPNARLVDGDRLLSRSRRRNRLPSVLVQRTSRHVALGLLSRMASGRLTVIDHVEGETSSHGPTGASSLIKGEDGSEADIRAVIEVYDPRAWSAVVTEGSAGLGRGYVERWWSSPDPVDVVRVLIANLGPVDELRNRLAAMSAPVSDPIRRMLPRSGRTRNRQDISAHYDLGNAFFSLFLDETLTYSSGIFPSPGVDLAGASRHKYDSLIESLDLDGGHHLLEIGTGWGGMAIQAAERTGCRVTTTTISNEQLTLARDRVRAAGLEDRVEVVSTDWRDLRGQYDRVVSVEMIEAVDWRHYKRFFATIERCLKPDGKAVLQAICVPDRRYRRTRNTEDFIRRFVFPGGFLPSIGAIVNAVATATRMQVLGVTDFSAHYAETLRRWRGRFEQGRTEVSALGLDDRFYRLWQFYLAYCEAGFRERHSSVNHVSLVGRNWRPSLADVPPPVS